MLPTRPNASLQPYRREGSCGSAAMLVPAETLPATDCGLRQPIFAEHGNGLGPHGCRADREIRRTSPAIRSARHCRCSAAAFGRATAVVAAAVEKGLVAAVARRTVPLRSEPADPGARPVAEQIADEQCKVFARLARRRRIDRCGGCAAGCPSPGRLPAFAGWLNVA